MVDNLRSCSKGEGGERSKRNVNDINTIYREGMRDEQSSMMQKARVKVHVQYKTDQRGMDCRGCGLLSIELVLYSPVCLGVEASEDIIS